MASIKTSTAVFTLLVGMGSAGVARADVIRSCTAQLWVRLTYQPKGRTNVEKKTEPLKTTKTAVRDGRVGGMDLPHKIAEAKKRGCTEAVQDLMRRYSSWNSQSAAVCEAVQNSETLIPRSNVQDELYPEADWYQIDQMFARGKRDAISVRGDIKNVERRKFQCDGGRVILANPPQPPRGDRTSPPSHSEDTPAPPPTSVADTDESEDAAPPPPPSVVVGERLPDLFISNISLSPAVPIKGQPVEVRVSVRNIGAAPASAFTVQWWPGENYPEPACSWNVDRLAARSGRVLRCRYAGYPSWYARINTKAVADTSDAVTEKVENNNHRRMEIRVAKP